MLLIAGGALGLVAGLLTGGRMSNLLGRRLRWPLVVIAAFAVRELLLRSPLGTSLLGPPAFALSLAALIAWTIWHRDELPGILIVTAGMSMNLLVTLANGGHMPVATAALDLGPSQLRAVGTWAQYGAMGPGTHLGWLGDWIQFPGLIGRLFPQAYSPGDLVSLVGLTAVLFLATRPRRTAEPRRAITSR
jgi:hypothetical protein